MIPMPSIVRRVTAVPTAMALGLCVVLGAVSLPARGQPDEVKGQTWAQIEQGNDMRRLRDTLRLGEPLTQEDVTFINQTLLPQLESSVNRPQIDRVVRRKLRDLQNVTDNPATFEQFTKLTADFMLKLARNDRKEPIVRVNAALLVGELNDDSKKRPWPGSLAPLVAIVADGALSPEVRIAAAAGLQRHADAARQAGDSALTACAEKIAPLMTPLLSPPAGIDRAAADWLAGRGLTILRSLAGADPAGVATAAAVLHDDARPLDLRIRSASVVASGKAKDLDAAKVVASVDSIARRLLEEELRAADEQRPAAGKPAAEPPAPPGRRQAARRLSWALATLADALFGEDTTGGVASLLAEPEAAKDLARRLRQAAAAIDKTPGREAVAAALAGLTGAPPQPDPQPPRPQPTEKPPAEPETDNPFK